MRIVLFGAPGSGKGTQANVLAARSGAAHISTGDALREAVANKTEVGLRAKAFMDGGALVPDEVVIAIARDRLAGCGAAGFILDGFPRTIAQAKALDAALAEMGKPLEHVVNLIVAEDELVRRLSGRWVCPACGEPYNVASKPPRVDGVCDKCGGRLVQRDDDKIDAIKNRLQVYAVQTAPLLDYYGKSGILRNVEATGGIDEIGGRVAKAIEG